MKYFLLVFLCALIVTQLQSSPDLIVTLGVSVQNMASYFGSMFMRFYSFTGLNLSECFLVVRNHL